LFNYNDIKPLLFKLEAENAHNIIEKILHYGADNLSFITNRYIDKNFVIDKSLTQNLFNKKFLNPIGIGAGFDKNATMLNGLRALGFGYSEIGTVTPKAQVGNQKPRLFRHIDESSLQNAMGFNNDGAFAIERRLNKIKLFSTPLGINIGKNKLTPDEYAIEDYIFLIKTFEHIADYLVINISSPNTPNLRDLQNEKFIEELFTKSKSLTSKPILLKIAPDIKPDIAISLCKSAVENGAGGIIATNTTIDYTLVKSPKNIGGISGEALKDKSEAIFKQIAQELYNKTTLISVGGISSANDAYKRIKLGASLIQIYSSLIFKGPSLIKDINTDLVQLIKNDGYTNISQVVGKDISNG